MRSATATIPHTIPSIVRTLRKRLRIRLSQAWRNISFSIDVIRETRSPTHPPHIARLQWDSPWLRGWRDKGLKAAQPCPEGQRTGDRKSTRLNSSHDQISYAVFCLKKKIHNH